MASACRHTDRPRRAARRHPCARPGPSGRPGAVDGVAPHPGGHVAGRCLGLGGGPDVLRHSRPAAHAPDDGLPDRHDQSASDGRSDRPCDGVGPGRVRLGPAQHAAPAGRRAVRRAHGGRRRRGERAVVGLQLPGGVPAGAARPAPCRRHAARPAHGAPHPAHGRDPAGPVVLQCAAARPRRSPGARTGRVGRARRGGGRRVDPAALAGPGGAGRAPGAGCCSGPGLPRPVRCATPCRAGCSPGRSGSPPPPASRRTPRDLAPTAGCTDPWRGWSSSWCGCGCPISPCWQARSSRPSWPGPERVRHRPRTPYT